MRSFLARLLRKTTNLNRLRGRKYQNSLPKFKLAESSDSSAHWVSAFSIQFVVEVVTPFGGFEIPRAYSQESLFGLVP